MSEKTKNLQKELSNAIFEQQEKIELIQEIENLLQTYDPKDIVNAMVFLLDDDVVSDLINNLG